ncbi:hypothetical protein DPMN_103266 [Dreissena polymorpha]|uniref:Uncharacterized protein n=1 Tax=Dreissena polymorpha TaxID=45954 RepID=A0A9D4JZ13_DREPO|nr:hypothetical protein DPMN_103266 [Dreissena polymorpha]
MNSGKRTLSSTASETYTDTSLLETSVFEKGKKCESSSQVSSKLSHVLTKEDSSFIKDILKETVEQFKDKLLGNVID